MKKIGLLCLALVLALGALGVGYGLWDKTVYIAGTVNTGEVDAIMSVGNCYDDEIEGKDYSSISCVLAADPQILLVTITDAYPCITYTCNFDITNTGTVPVIVNGYTVTSNLPAGATLVVPDFVGTQIEPKESVYGMLHVHLDNDAEELTTYTFEVAIWLVQWNEYPYPLIS